MRACHATVMQQPGKGRGNRSQQTNKLNVRRIPEWTGAGDGRNMGTSHMREKKQDVVVALVHKEMDGARPLSESILFQYEVPTIGVASWALVVLIDFLGTCKQTSPALQKQLYSGLPGFYDFFAKEFEWSKSDFTWRSRLSWTCLDCPHSHCQLDERLAKQVKVILQAIFHLDDCVSFFLDRMQQNVAKGMLAGQVA